MVWYWKFGMASEMESAEWVSAHVPGRYVRMKLLGLFEGRRLEHAGSCQAGCEGASCGAIGKVSVSVPPGSLSCLRLVQNARC